MRTIPLFIALIMLAPAAVANRVTFSDLDYTFGTYTEDGVSISGGDGDLYTFVYPEAVHLDSSYTPAASFLEVSMPSGLFRANAMDVLSFPPIYDIEFQFRHRTTGEMKFEYFPLLPYANLFVTGFRSNVPVVQDTFWMDDVSHYQFSEAFDRLDRLIVGVMEPNFRSLANTFFRSYITNGYELASASCTLEPCTHVSLDNIDVSPVPLPGSLLLMGSLLVLLGIRPGVLVTSKRM